MLAQRKTLEEEGGDPPHLSLSSILNSFSGSINWCLWVFLCRTFRLSATPMSPAA